MGRPLPPQQPSIFWRRTTLIKLQTFTDGLLRAPTKTITFTGSAGAGATGTVAVWTVSGSVWIPMVTSYCTTLLTEALATATVSLGTATSTALLLPVTNSVNIDAAEFWTTTNPATSSALAVASQQNALVNENIIITCATQATNAGVLVFDCWYRPLTAGATLT